ncbi:MAG: hypothetical protein ACYTG5_08365 [Planctomycetota bacterium]|jgi:hypothetical protein
MRQAPIVLLAGFVLASSLSSQAAIGRTRPNDLPGDGTLPVGSTNLTFNMKLAIGDDGSGFVDFHGITRLPNGNFLVSNGKDDFAITKKFFELGPNGSWIATVEQPNDFGLSGRQGYTNLNWDRDTSSDSRVWGTRARSFRSYDWQAGAFDDLNDPNLFIGLKTVDDYEGAEIRASAIGEENGELIWVVADRKTNTMQFSNVNYYTVTNQLVVVPPHKPATPDINPPMSAFDTGKFGAAWDPIRKTVWWHIDDNDGNPNPIGSSTRFMEMDMDGNLTGQVIQGDPAIGGVARGCDMYVDAFGNLVLAYIVDMDNVGNNPLNIADDEDVLVEMYGAFGYGGSCAGEISFETEPFIGNPDFALELSGAPSNSLDAAILLRGQPIPAPGFPLPFITNCNVLVDLGNYRALPASTLSGGEATYQHAIPQFMTLIGAEVAFQWILPTDPGILPLDLSNAGLIHVKTNM